MRSFLAGFTLLAIMTVGASIECRAQDAGVQFTNEFDPRNFAQASFLGSGFYFVGDRQIYIVRIKGSLKLRSEEEHPWGLRLTFRPTLGFYDFNPTDRTDFGLPDELGSFSFLPGVEFRVPVKDNWRLDPFLEAGPAMEFDTDSVTWIYGLGVRSRAEFPVKNDKLLLWNSLLWAGNWESDVSPRDDFLVFDTTFEWRHPIGWTLFGYPTDIGPLIKAEYYIGSLLIAPPLGEPFEIDQRYEIGMTWGPTERSKKWKMTIPRIGLSYRFGNGSGGVRFVLTSKF
jgi:hypothetical protein